MEKKKSFLNFSPASCLLTVLDSAGVLAGNTSVLRRWAGLETTLGQGTGRGKGKAMSREPWGHFNEGDTVPLPACSLPAAEEASGEERAQPTLAP